MADLSTELNFQGMIAGVDEAGRGPWAGPVVAGAVILDAHNIPVGIDDSKKLSAKARESLYELILMSAKTGIGIATVQEIDRLNILQATMLAMQRAVSLLGVAPDVALIDGNKAPKLACKTQTLVKGDSISLSIAAASIIAKVTRDRIMCELAQQFPFYGWERNSGYGTPAHRTGLEKYGICEHHRRSYAPIKKYLHRMAA